MADKKHFIVIGLGEFGSTLARRLSENRCRVTGLDRDKDRVEAEKSRLYEAVIADATDRSSLEQLSLADADAVFISLGGTIIPSLLAALHAKELGARRLIVKGLDQEHGRLLQHLGVERVVFPGIEAAVELADRMTWPNVLDFVPIDPEYSFVEITVPDSWHGKTLADINLRRKYGTWVVGVKDALTATLDMFPDGDFQLSDDQLLLVVGKQDELNRLREQK